ncbi:MAG TPA: acyl-CoA dehydrogenase family protein, partial [Myxococcota bacterium]
MAMNVQTIPGVSDRINQIRMLTAKIINQEILPHENEIWAARSQGASDADRKRAHELREGVKARVKEAGLWAPHLPEQFGGCGLGFLEHAYMNEVLAYCVGAAALFGVVAPNSGNQKILAQYGTKQQIE